MAFTDFTPYKYVRSVVIVFVSVTIVITVNKHETKALIQQTLVDCTGQTVERFFQGRKGEERLRCTHLSPSLLRVSSRLVKKVVFCQQRKKKRQQSFLCHESRFDQRYKDTLDKSVFEKGVNRKLLKCAEMILAA